MSGPRFGVNSLPVQLQSELAECGLACLAMVASYHRHEVDLAALRRRFGTSLRGSTLLELVGHAEALGMSARPVKVELEDVERLKTPAILHWDLNHFVVLKGVRRGLYVVHDPASGRKLLRLSEFRKHFTGVALELEPTAGFERRTVRERINLLPIARSVSGLGRNACELLGLALVLQGVAVLSPLYMQMVIDEVVVGREDDLLVALALGFALVAGFRVAVTALRDYVVLVASSAMSTQLGAGLFRHLLRLPLDYFAKRQIGDIVSRFRSLDPVRQWLSSGLVTGAVDAFMACAMFAMMLLYSPALAALGGLATALYLALRAALYRPLRDRTEAAVVCGAREQSHFMESVRSMRVIKLLCGERQRHAGWSRRYVDRLNAELELGKLQILNSALNGVLFGLENVLVVYLASRRIIDGEFSVGAMVAFMAYKTQFTQRVSDCIERLFEWRALDVHLTRLADVALTQAEEQDAPGTVFQTAPLEGALSLNDLAYRYGPNDPWLFERLNLQLERGESVAIVGPSGCGKSTLVKLLLGFLEPSAGAVRIGGRTIRDVGARAWRTRVAAVLQDDQLLAGSIADNICFFDANPDHEKIRRCAALAAINLDVEALPMKYQTLVGELGTTLSGGQQQRLLLARALYREPEVLILDEATSHLDVRLEGLVNAAVARLAITRVIIAHRPETIASADRIFALHGGALVELPRAEFSREVSLRRGSPHAA